MSWIEVDDYKYPRGWGDTSDAGTRSNRYCEQLEAGNILFFKEHPFAIDRDDLEFLVVQKHAESSVHKNVSYRPATEVLRGGPSPRTKDGARLKEIMRSYSLEVDRFLATFLKGYDENSVKDYASYRPIEENGRRLPLRKRNDLLHVDAFPSRPTRGGRILRIFSNLNREYDRVWLTTDNFERLANKYAVEAGLDRIASKAESNGGSLLNRIAHLADVVGLKVKPRAPYDRFMLAFHNFLKENSAFQKETPKIRLEFPPGSTWIVFTDAVPHAVLSGRYALEQTYIIPTKSLIAPSQAPIRILERLCGKQLSGVTA